MKTDKTSADKGTSRAVTEGPTSATEKGSHPTNQMNRTSASCVPAYQIHSSTKDHLFSSEKKTDPNTLDFSPAPTSGEKSTPMNPVADRPNRVDSCIHKQTKNVATIEGHSSSNISNPITNVGTEPLASQCLHDDKPANNAHGIETGRDRNSDRASLLQAGGSYRTFKCLTNCEETEDILEVKQHVAAAAATSNIPRSLPRGEPVDDNDRTEAGQGSNGAAAAAAAAAAEASKIPRSLQLRGEPVDDNDRIEAGQGSNGDVASFLQAGGSCTKLTTANTMVHDFQNISKPLHAAVGATVKEIASDVSLTLTFADGYSSNSPRPIPKENTDAADVASKIVPEAAAADGTRGFAEEAKKVRYIFFDSFKPKAFVFSIARKSQLIFYFFFFIFFDLFLTKSYLH